MSGETVRRLVLAGPRRAEVVDEELGELPDGCVRVATSHTGLSAGTELAWFKGTNPMLVGGWDPELALFRGAPAGAAAAGDGFPVRRLGYMETGLVTESRTAALPPGTRVAATYGHASGYLLDPTGQHVARVPAGLDPLLGVYVAHMGPICANGILHADAELSGGSVDALGAGIRGRTVVVVGAGVVGLLTGLFALHLGAGEVISLDASPHRLAAAAALGMVPVLDELADGVGTAVQVKRRWRHGPGDHGADVVFQCRGQAGALGLALRCLRPQGTVVDLAFYQGGADEVRLGEEFHHNGLSVRCAHIARVPRGLAHRWDRARLSAETVALLDARGPEILRHMVTDVLPLEQAPALLSELADRRRKVVQAVFTC